MPISQEMLKRIILEQHENQTWPQLYIHRTADQKLIELSQNPEVIVVTGR